MRESSCQRLLVAGPIPAPRQLAILRPSATASGGWLVVKGNSSGGREPPGLLRQGRLPAPPALARPAHHPRPASAVSAVTRARQKLSVRLASCASIAL